MVAVCLNSYPGLIQNNHTKGKPLCESMLFLSNSPLSRYRHLENDVMLFGMKTRSRVVLDTLNTRAIMRNKDHCCVPKCNNNRSKVQSNITFHQFPKDKDLRRQWIIKIKRDVGRSFKVNGLLYIIVQFSVVSALFI